MPLSAEQRVAFLALVSAGADPKSLDKLLAFATQNREAVLDEIGARPGFSQVRAIALRILPHLLPDGPARRELLAQAGRALMGPVDADPTAQLARHPAWIGLGVLGLADLLEDWEGDPVERAVELAGRAFSEVGGTSDLDEGEVLWAMAEQAGDVGWTERSDALLERAIEASFADPAHRAQVRLLMAMRLEEQGRSPRSLLALVAEDDQAIDRDRVHAAWILGHLRHEEGDPDGAIEILTLAAELVDRDTEPDVAERIDGVLGRWLGGGVP